MRNGELAVGLVHDGGGGVAGRNVAAVRGLVRPEDVEKNGVAACPGGGVHQL